MSDNAEIVADASAVLALLKGETFRHFAPERISGATISTVNYSEIVATLLTDGLTEPQIDAAMSELDLQLSPFDEPQARRAAALRPLTRRLGLSLGDRACLALALISKKPAVTADQAWSKLDIGAEIVLIR